MSRMGDLIRDARISSGLPAKAFAKKCGVSESYLLDVESGRRIVNDAVAARFLKAAGRNTDALIPQPEANEPAPRRAPAPAPAAKPSAVAAVEPTDTWREALSALVRQVPVVDAAGKAAGVFPMAVENGKVQGYAPEKLHFFLVPDDRMREHRLFPGDKALIVPDQTLSPGKLMLVEIRGERMVRILRERYSGKVALATDDAPAKIYSERDVNVLGRVVLSISSF